MRQLEPGLQLRAYRLERRIGRGAEGDVWLALTSRGRPIALKARPHTDDEDARRFRSEFARLRTLRLPGVVRVLDVGADQGYLFFTMELAEGEPFDSFASASQTTGDRVRRVVAAGAQVARALASIHRLNLAHRDIKPANIHVTEDLVSREVTATVLDFGTHHFGATQHEEHILRGTPIYMAPEQRLGMPHDHRVDLYSLGVVLHEALSGLGAASHQAGQRRPSLVHRGPEFPLGLADLVDLLLSLDPAARPTAEEAQAILDAIVQGHPLPPANWPKPVIGVGEVTDLLEGHGVVVGTLGDGVDRHIAEARLQWYRKGYPSVSGQCNPARAYSAWQTVLAQLFNQRSAADRKELAGEHASVLQAIWPGLTVPVDRPLTFLPSAAIAARAINTVLERVSPIAIVLLDVDQADPGSAKVLPLVLDDLDPRNRIWASARQPIEGLPVLHPPAWSPELHAQAWTEFFGPNSPCSEPTETGRGFLRQAWAIIGETRGTVAIPDSTPDSLIRLSILSEPFPYAVAVQMAPDLDTWCDEGLLEVVVPEAGITPHTLEHCAQIRFGSQAVRLLAQAEAEDPAEGHRLAAMAWARFPDSDHAIRARAKHMLTAGDLDPTALEAVIEIEHEYESPSEVRRWLDLLEVYMGPDIFETSTHAFELACARLWARLQRHPATVSIHDVRDLAVRADTPFRRGLAAHFKLAHAIRGPERDWIVKEGRTWANKLAESHPGLASRMLREIAIAHLTSGRTDKALRDSEASLELARRASNLLTDDDTTAVTDIATPILPVRLTQPEINAATTVTASLVYVGRPDKSDALCHTMASRCRNTGNTRGHAAFLINRAIALLQTGDRRTAADSLAEAQGLQHTHADPVVFANWAVIAARLAVERGDAAAGRLLLDEAISAGQSLDDADLLGEAWACVLDLAAQTGDRAEAVRALSIYGTDTVWSTRDHWPAALARWRWAVGDLEGALEATESSRKGFSHACVQAERSRLLLVQGDRNAAAACAQALLRTGTTVHLGEITDFCHLVLAAARAAPDAAFEPLIVTTRESRWVHLYLGALHLDAIRRRIRGENVSTLIRRLQARSADLDHRLYHTLAAPQGW